MGVSRGLCGICVCGGLPYEVDTQSTVKYIKLLPAGDSITEGFNCSGAIGGWREPLQAYLGATNAIYDFVGTGPTMPYSFGMTDPEHSGWAGYCVAPSGCGYGSLLTKIPADAAAYLPDIIVLMAGTNDALSSSPVSTFTANYNTLLDAIIAASPSSRIIIAAIPNAKSNQTVINSFISQYNVQLQSIAFSRGLSYAAIPNIPDSDIDGCYDWHYKAAGNVTMAQAILGVI